LNTKILLGRGALTWSRYEQETERYGTVHFDKRRGPIAIGGVLPANGVIGTLVAEVTATRKSKYLADLSHKAWSSTPTVGQLIRLGRGRFFSSLDKSKRRFFGVEPLDGRHTLWMDIHALFKVHDQDVILYLDAESSKE
jgi:hypothetical protein